MNEKSDAGKLAKLILRIAILHLVLVAVVITMLKAHIDAKFQQIPACTEAQGE